MPYEWELVTHNMVSRRERRVDVGVQRRLSVIGHVITEPVDRESGSPSVEVIAGGAMKRVGPPNQHVSRLQARMQDATILAYGW